VTIRLLRLEDAEALAELYVDNRAYLAPYEPERAAMFYTTAGQTESISGLLQLFEQGRAYPYVIEVGGAIAGRINVTNVARGPFCSANLGYWVCASHTGRGVASAAVNAVAAASFGQHQLHRLEAATLVDNIASQKVLARTGFSRIGLAPTYLHIAGSWRDHLLFQRVADDDGPPATGPSDARSDGSVLAPHTTRHMRSSSSGR
jgi:ribosomal-protein-alanine N-acetyltransferase